MVLTNKTLTELVKETSIHLDSKILINQGDKIKFNRIFMAKEHSMGKIKTLDLSKFNNYLVIKSFKTMKFN